MYKPRILSRCSVTIITLITLFSCLVPASKVTAKTVTIIAAEDADQINGSMRTNPWKDNKNKEWRRVMHKDNTVLAGFRFEKVFDTIPANATITKVTLEFPSTSAKKTKDTRIRYYCEKNTASPQDFSTQDLESRTLTDSYVEWQPDKKNRPDLLTIFIEAISQPGWSDDNDIVIITKTEDTKSNAHFWVRSANGSPESKKPKLVIDFEVPEPAIDVDTTSLGPTCFEGYSPTSQSLTVTETSGVADFIGTVTTDVSWISLSVPNGGFTASNPLPKGESATVGISYNTTNLTAGTYNGTITIDGDGSNTPRTISVTLLVKDVPASAACGEIPLYAQNLINPAIMVQLDTSGSMRSQMPILSSGKNPRTPSLVSIVQEIVNQPVIDDPTAAGYPKDGWQENNNMAFVISGTGKRRAFSYDGQSVGAPKLTVTYHTASDSNPVTVEYRVSQSGDDVQKKWSALKTNEDYLELGRSGDPVGLLFRNVAIPNGAIIDEAEIQFVINQGDSTPTDLVIHGILQETASDFTDLLSLSSSFTTASVSWNNVERWDHTMSRIAIAEDVLKEVFLDRSINWGFATWAGGSCRTTDVPPDDDWTDYRLGIHDHDANHQTQLQDKADDGSPGGCTPLAPSMNAAYKYFISKSRKDLYYKEFYKDYDCQPKVVVIVTDGIGNTATTMDLVRTRTQALLDAGVSVVAVGFGIDESSAGQLYEIAKLAQAKGKESDTDQLFALHDEDASGTGVPFLAQSREDFINAMTSIVSSVKAQAFHGSSPAPTTSADNGEILLSSEFEPTYWTGNLTATKFDPFTGALESSTLWSAADKMPAFINGYIADSSSLTGVSKYLDSSLATDNYLCKPLGDIIHSTPKIVGKPAFWYNFDKYSGFKFNLKVNQRQPLAYVGANDGALHAFNLSTGVEEWRFYPDSVKAKLNQMGIDPTKDMCSSSYCHEFLLDGSPQAADIYNGTDWKTILVTGLGRGGSSYFALDVTYGNDFGPAASADEEDTPSSLLWEFTDSELGLATAFPEIERVASNTLLPASESLGTWVTLLSSGRLENPVLQVDKEAYLFGLNAWNASAVWKDSADQPTYKVKLAPTTLKNDSAGPAVGIDLDDDYLIDRIYLANRYGNLYRLHNIGKGEQPVSKTFFYSGNSSSSSLSTATPAIAKPGFAFAGDDDHDGIHSLWLYFGTGQYEDQIDKVTSDQQYFYGLFDEEGSSTDPTNPEDAAWVPADLAKLSTTVELAYALDEDGNKVDLNGDGSITSDDMQEYRKITCASPETDGSCNIAKESWRLSLATNGGSPSERAFTNPLVVSGIVFFTSFIPDGDPCKGNGKAYLFAVDYETGSFPETPVFDINNDNSFTPADKFVRLPDGTDFGVGGIYIGEGKPYDPVLRGNVLFAGTSSSQRVFNVNLPGKKVRLKSWRQRFNN